MGFKESWNNYWQGWKPTTETFASNPPVVYDGEIVNTVDQRIRMVFNGSLKISKQDALSIPAVLRGRNLICNIATLPLITQKKNLEVVEREFLRQINPDVPNLKTLADTVEDLLFNAKAYWLVDAWDSKGWALRAHHVAFDLVEKDEQGFYWVDGVKVSRDRIIDFYSPNPALLSTIASSIQRARALAAASTMYAEKPVPKVLISAKADVDPDIEVIDEAMDQLENAAAESPFVYVSAGLEATPMNMLSPSDLQLMEAMRMVAIDLANALGIDPEDLGISTTSRTYQNAVDRRKDRVNDVLNVYMQAITARLSMNDVTPRGWVVKFDQDDYLRADALTRAQVEEIQIRNQIIAPSEARTREGYAPMTPAQLAEIAGRTTNDRVEQ
jgi:hypothetical protein